MLPFKKVLCTTDFSEPSYEALQAASELAVHFSAELCLVHVVTPTPITVGPMVPTSFDVIAYQNYLESDAQKQLQELVEQRLPRGLKSCTALVVTGYAADEIVRIANEQKIDLIVIATHGHTGWRGFVFGSVAEKVVRLAPCPVMAIRPLRNTK
jgi:nucleotide-binding universal stress UspA family protein